MKLKVDLYINDQLVDVINSEQFAQQFAITYSFSDLYEPDKVVDSYSKTITIPATKRNNEIFANIWSIDSDTIEMFNPSQLSDFRIMLNDSLWQSGTVQLKSIKIKDGARSYEIVLFGAVTKIMSMLLNSDIDDINNKLLRNLKFSHKLKHNLNLTVMNGFWNNYYYNGFDNLASFMNYVPCQNGLYDNFDSAKKLTIRNVYNSQGQGTGQYYLACVPYMWSESNAGGTITQVDSGSQEFDEYMTNEFRVEYQRPAIKMNKLLEQIVSDIAPDASIELDSSFFSSSNPYYSNTYLTLSQYTTEDDEGTVLADSDYYSTKYLDTGTTSTSWDLQYYQVDGNLTIFAPDSSTVVYYGNVSGTKQISLEFMMKVSVLSTFKISKGNYSNEPYFMNGYFGGTMGQNYMNNWTWQTWGVQSRGIATSYGDMSTPFTNGAFDSSVNTGIYSHNRRGSGSGTYYYNNFQYDSYNSNYSRYEYVMFHNDIKNIFSSYTPSNDTKYQWKPFKITINVSNLTDNGYIRLYLSNVDHRFIAVNDGWTARSNNTFPVLVSLRPITKAPSGTSTSNLNNYYPYSYGWTGHDATLQYNSAIRSGVGVTTEDMFDTTTTQGEILLNYTKLLGMVYETTNEGKLKIMPRNKFFEGYRIIDWSDKIDYSRDIEITPLTFDTRNLEMKVASGDSYYEEKYRNEFGLEYGEKKINTGFAFNTKVTELLDSIFVNTVVATEPRKTYYIDNMKIVSHYITPLPFPAYFSKDGETKSPTNTKYSLLFRNGTMSPGWTVNLTIDSSFMLSTDASVDGGQYCWLEPAIGITELDRYRLTRSTIPSFTTHYDNVSWDVGYPRISYDGATTNTYPSGATVYSRFWENYISEIYDVRNKIMKCYVKLSWIDILNFSFRNFVTINGTLWHPNKIINYNPLSDDPVQVELIKVSNIEGYTSGQNYEDIVS